MVGNCATKLLLCKLEERLDQLDFEHYPNNLERKNKLDKRRKSVRRHQTKDVSYI